MFLWNSLSSTGQMFLCGLVVMSILSGLDKEERFFASVSTGTILGVMITLSGNHLLIPAVVFMFIIFGFGRSVQSTARIIGYVAMIVLAITELSIRDGIAELKYEWFTVCLIIITVELVTRYVAVKLRRKKLQVS